MPWNPVWFLGQEPRTPRVPYGEDTRIHTYLPILESSIGQCHNYDKSTWHIYDKNDKAICHFLIRLAFVTVSYTHLRAHETRHELVCRLLLVKKKEQCTPV